MDSTVRARAPRPPRPLDAPLTGDATAPIVTGRWSSTSSASLERSAALQDFVRECNRGRPLRLVADAGELG
jgi:hypothetical protein